MAGAEKLIERILDEARRQAQANVEKAEKEAEAILRAAKEKAEEKERIALEKARINADEKKRRMIASAELDAKKERLKAKQEIIESAFNMAIEKLNSLPEDQYFDILADMMAGIVKGESCEIILSGRDKERLNAAYLNNIRNRLKEKGYAGNVDVSSETRDIKGGFILKMGDIEINNSFDAILRMKRDELEPEVVKILFQS
ncbi:MAG TPA: hypothetical protein GXX14_13250 [Clostridiaceae bacterium]|nr:hypothetical protein [Clostridiaceae bacterium]